MKSYSIFEVTIPEQYLIHQFTLNDCSNCEIDWGDGYIDNNITSPTDYIASHLYTNVGTYTIKISNKCKTFKHDIENNYVSKIISLAVGLKSCYQMFYNCKQLTNIDTSKFKLPKKCDVFESMFENCDSLKCNINSIIPDDYTFIKQSNLIKMFKNCLNIFGQLNENIFSNKQIKSYSDCFTNCINIDNYNLIPLSWGGPNQQIKNSTKNIITFASSPTLPSSSSSLSSTSSSTSTSLLSNNNITIHTNPGSFKTIYKINKKETLYKGNNININKFHLTTLANNINYNRYNLYQHFDELIYDFDLNKNFDQKHITNNIITTNTLEGYVYERHTNEIIPNASVKLVKQNKIIYETVTDENGYYTINNILYGLYDIKCSVNDIHYDSSSEIIDLKSIQQNIFNHNMFLNSSSSSSSSSSSFSSSSSSSSFSSSSSSSSSSSFSSSSSSSSSLNIPNQTYIYSPVETSNLNVFNFAERSIYNKVVIYRKQNEIKWSQSCDSKNFSINTRNYNPHPGICNIPLPIGKYRIRYVSGAANNAGGGAPNWNREWSERNGQADGNDCSHGQRWMTFQCTYGVMPGFNDEGYNSAAEAEADNIGKYMDIQINDNLGLDIWYDDWYSPDNVGNIVYDIIQLDGDTNYNYVNTYTNKLNSLTFDSNYTYQLIYSYV